MNKPVIELKAIKHAAFASQETHCYSATLYVDGVRWGEVRNEGHGGPDMFHGVGGKTWENLAELDKRIAATFPPIEFEGLAPISNTLECVCGELVNDWLYERDYKRASSRNALFIKPGEKGLFQFPLKGTTAEKALPVLRAKYPAYQWLADLPPAEALALYRAGGAA